MSRLYSANAAQQSNALSAANLWQSHAAERARLNPEYWKFLSKLITEEKINAIPKGRLS